MSIDVLPSCSSALYESSDKQCGRRSSHKSNNKYETEFVKNTVALAVISKLHKWCCQLFWLTIVCVIGCYGELNSSKQKTLQDVRRNIFNSNARRCKTLTDLELQLLRHLTCPQSALHRPLRPSPHRKKQLLSRMPSPQLFNIIEDDEPVE